jgi:CubicO group peptidase (beta-lactamase class C family)
MIRCKALVLPLLLLPAFALLAQSDLSSRFDDIMNKAYPADGTAATVLVSRKGEIIYHKAFGMANLELGVPARPEHIFRIGSVSKQFTAVAILQLAEAGLLSLNDDITRFIPDYPTKGKKITIEQLLNHTSGIKSYTDMDAWDAMVRRKDFLPSELVDFFKNEPLDFEPGTRWSYNNSGYVLLGYIIEKISGLSYADYVDQKFFKPLGMKNSFYGHVMPVIKNRVPGYSRAEGSNDFQNMEYLSMTQPYAAGSLLSTVEDLFIWTRAVNAGKVISPESLKKAYTACILPSGENTHYGYGWGIGNMAGSTVIEHTGGINGFLSVLMYLPEQEVCVAALTNCDCEPPANVAEQLAAVAAGIPFQPEALPLPPAKVLESYVGVYENAKGEQRVITVENGHLYSQRSGSSRFELIPYQAPDYFFFQNSFARIRFEREKKGDKKVLQALFSDRQRADEVWKKTDKPIPAGKTQITLSEADLQKFLGEYQIAPGFSITVTKENAQLYCQATGQQRFEVFPETPNRFFLKVVEATIEFFPEADGKVNKMILYQAGQEIPGTRVK